MRNLFEKLKRIGKPNKVQPLYWQTFANKSPKDIYIRINRQWNVIHPFEYIQAHPAHADSLVSCGLSQIEVEMKLYNRQSNAEKYQPKFKVVKND